MCTKILMIDDQVLFSEAVVDVLKRDEKYQNVRTAACLKDAISEIENEKPDIILLDLNLGEQSGFNILSYLKHEENPHLHDIQVIILSVRKDSMAISKAYRMKAKAYLDKTCHISELKTAIDTVMNNGTFFSDEVLRKIRESEEMEEEFTTEMLSGRENQVLKLLCESYTSKEIASQLKISFNTVNIYRKNLLHKFGVNNTSGLIKIAMQNGLYS